MPDRGRRLVFSLYFYYLFKITHLFYQTGLVFYLLGVYKNIGDAAGFSVITAIVLALIMFSFYLKSSHGETLQLRFFVWEHFAIVMEIIILAFAVIGYAVLAIVISFEYNTLEQKEKLYNAYHNKSTEVQFNETNTTPVYTYDTTEELIETTHNILYSEDVSLSLISLMNVKENTSEKMDPSGNECKRTANQTSLPDSCEQMFEDFYYNFIIKALVIPNVINIIPLAIIVAIFGFSEYTKFLIRRDADRAAERRRAMEREIELRALSAARQNEGFGEEEELDTSV